MDEQTLEPCPFCGETELRVAFSHEAGRWDIWEVECETCCVSKDGELGHVGDEARQSAITCWNRRAAHSVIAGKVAERPSTIAAAFLELCVLARKLARKDHTDPRVATLHDAATILEQEYPQHIAALAPYPERRSE